MDFSAEYSDLQSGMVSIVTKEGNPKQFKVTANIKYSPYQNRNFASTDISGNVVLHRYSMKTQFFLRPYLDDEVCWTGTKNGAWDLNTQGEYAEFAGLECCI